MFIFVAYKDAPELSNSRRPSAEVDLALEKILLVNPNCPVRIMLEYIRKSCKLGIYTQFDLCDEHGVMKGLFNMPTFEPALDQFENKKTYYVIVIRKENDKRISVLPQLNHENRLYLELKTRVRNFMTGEVTPAGTSPARTSPIKTPPAPAAQKPSIKMK